MDGVIPGARVCARVLIACAVLVGLVFMHGLGTAIGTGCPGGTGAVTTSAATHGVGGHEAAMTEATTTMSGSQHLASAPGSTHGSVCDSLPPRGDPAGRLAHAATEPAEPVVVGRTARGVERAGDASARAGPTLLISLCVSRT